MPSSVTWPFSPISISFLRYSGGSNPPKGQEQPTEGRSNPPNIYFVNSKTDCQTREGWGMGKMHTLHIWTFLAGESGRVIISCKTISYHYLIFLQHNAPYHKLSFIIFNTTNCNAISSKVHTTIRQGVLFWCCSPILLTRTFVLLCIVWELGRWHMHCPTNNGSLVKWLLLLVTHS